jgi:hypothetical protein
MSSADESTAGGVGSRADEVTAVPVVVGVATGAVAVGVAGRTSASFATILLSESS